MKHLLFCREYPPSSGGGIGAYAYHISNLLADAGETVHVISQAWGAAGPGVSEVHHGRLVVHRIAFEDWQTRFPPRPHPLIIDPATQALFHSGFFPLGFSWQAGLLAEKIVEEEGIDLIEAQEYEAPLYYFLLRRSLGLGPSIQPPCFVHLHSPTEFIARFNGWDPTSTWVRSARCLEAYCIQQADALLCPSQTLARQAETQFGLEQDRIQVIPLPLDHNLPLVRSDEVWKNGRICYTGRLERRKGILEWLQACVTVAEEIPGVEFEFAGANILEQDRVSCQLILTELIPRRLRGRFFFRGNQERTALEAVFQRARLAAVPSRWENFPYACMEAMRSGLPVIATRQGGMVEMIEDGRTGWLVEAAKPACLARGLREALSVSPTQLSQMGQQAAISIRNSCSPDKILDLQMAFRRKIVHRGTARSILMRGKLQGDLPNQKVEIGLSIVITSTGDPRLLKTTLASITTQTPASCQLFIQVPKETQLILACVREYAAGIPWVVETNSSRTGILASTVPAPGEVGHNPVGILFLQAGQQLVPGSLAKFEAIFHRDPSAGVVTSWIQGSTSGSAIEVLQDWEIKKPVYFILRMDAIRKIMPGTRFGPKPVWIKDLPELILSGGWRLVLFPEALLVDRVQKRRAFHLRTGLTGPWGRKLNITLIARHPFEAVKILAGMLLQYARGTRSKIG